MTMRMLLCGCLLGTGLMGCHAPYTDTGVATVRSQSGELQSCIGEASTRTPTLRGQSREMQLAFQVAPEGNVTDVTITRDEANDQGFADCITQHARSWRFPPPPSGTTEKFGYAFNAKFPQ